MSHSLPRVLADLPVTPILTEMLQNQVELVPWHAARETGAEHIQAIYTYGHPTVDEDLLNRLPASG